MGCGRSNPRKPPAVSLQLHLDRDESVGRGNGEKDNECIGAKDRKRCVIILEESLKREDERSGLGIGSEL
jgi:hypothetical protein